MVVGYLTVVFQDHVTPDAARHLTNEIASEAFSYGAVEAVKCDVGILSGEQEIDFWDEGSANQPVEQSP